MKNTVNTRHILSFAVFLTTALAIPTGGAAGDRKDGVGGNEGKFCSATALTLSNACENEVQSDYFTAQAICFNVSNDAEREECFADAKDSRDEGRQLCREQRTTRLDACDLIGEDRYDPDFQPAVFDDPKNPKNPNSYFPLTIGNLWEYAGGTEFNTVEVMNETKLIEGVTCIVIRDIVKDNGDLTEATDDWYAVANDGNVWYCGEKTQTLESFDGDNPRTPELLSVDGSFKAGRDGDKPGIIFPASPTQGQAYLEEFSLGNAEDATVILSTTYAFGHDAGLDQGVPQQLAERFCSGDCVVTRNFSLLEPGIFARKYYAPGIGVFLELETTGETSQLVNCNFDPRCVGLPTP
jgi:hypothetical protein